MNHSHLALSQQALVSDDNHGVTRGIFHRDGHRANYRTDHSGNNHTSLHTSNHNNYRSNHRSNHRAIAAGSSDERRSYQPWAPHTLVLPALGRRALLGVVVAIALCVGFALSVPQVLAQDASASSPELVNINTADAATLVRQLKGVGPTRAEEIVRHREAFGPFASTDELIEVKGIGQSTLDMNRSRITLE
jgi:competence protein ComEA